MAAASLTQLGGGGGEATLAVHEEHVPFISEIRDRGRKWCLIENGKEESKAECFGPELAPQAPLSRR
jgi:hypothetical protein